MEEALGPDNMHMVKALTPTLWHLTIFFSIKNKFKKEISVVEVELLGHKVTLRLPF